MRRDRIRRIIWFDSWQLEKMESWLAGYASKGWQLESIKGFTATFIKREPALVHYRCDVNPKNRLGDREKKLIYASAGWSYVCGWGACLIFVSNMEAIEIQTDPYAYVDIYRQVIVKTETKTLNYMTFLILTFYFFSNILSGISEPLLRDGVFSLWIVLVMLYFVIQFIREAAHTNSSLRKLKNGISLPRDTSHKFLLNIIRIWKTLLCTGIVIFLILSVFEYTSNIMRLFHQTDKGDCTAVIALSDVLGESQYALQLDSEGNSYSSNRSTLVPEQISLDESVKNAAGDSATTRVRLVSQRYRALTPGIAFLLGNSLSRQSYVVDTSFDFKGPLPYTKDKTGSFNYLWSYSNPDGSEHEFVAVKERTVYRIVFYGSGSIDVLLEMVKEKSAQNED